MVKNNLVENKGLSLSQAQSISNLCNQRAKEIEQTITDVNTYKKTVEINKTDHDILKARPIPENIVTLLEEKSKLHACQSFLMENLKAKDLLLKTTKNAIADVSSVEYPETPKYINPELLPEVDEKWGWEQLTNSEYNEYLEATAYASHIGQYIHKDSILDNLRSNINKIPDVEWINIEKDKKTLVTITKHHDSKYLLSLHEELATLHRKYEQRVNYFKSKVKNIVTEENIKISKHNNDLVNSSTLENEKLREQYNLLLAKADDEANKIKSKFEEWRNSELKRISSMRIEVDVRFQETIDTFLSKMDIQLGDV